jgi:outer membrane protein
MRSLLIIPVVALLPCSLARAESAPTALKIGYVDMARALNEVEDGKAAKAKLRSDFEEKQKKLDSMQTELKGKKDEFDKQSAMMKPEVRQQKQDELQRKFLELQQTYMQLQKELMDREQQVTQEIHGKLRTIVGKLGDRDGYNIILDIDETAVLYYKRHLDVTDDVVREYNHQYAASSAPSKK